MNGARETYGKVKVNSPHIINPAGTGYPLDRRLGVSMIPSGHRLIKKISLLYEDILPASIH
jgi:hypothetical protein